MFPTIQATCLQKNNQAFVCDPCGGYGKNLPIPVGAAVSIGENYWAVPVKDAYFQGFRFKIQTTAPTIDSIACFKLSNTLNNDSFMVIGTVAGYAAAAGACCDASPVPTLVVSPLANIASCQNTCTSDGTNYDAFFAVTPVANLAGKYVSRVEANGVLVRQQTYGTGSVSIAALVTYLNAQAGSVGVWSNPQAETIRLRTTLQNNVCFIACDKTS